ncbi:hypothetical protein Hypma_012176 [Hypsizygus marmoreus]|uniref:Uncharacterized protein n=1 Tax=Hypsizygus marmoreus TaxID=39966 RepID=A0A369JH02_HYPMA|nr:hypothetical protein Hypma_012176 [Hypsizygus marmoreus]
MIFPDNTPGLSSTEPPSLLRVLVPLQRADQPFPVVINKALNTTSSAAAKVFLDRPLTQYARVVYKSCSVDALINGAGWEQWSSTTPNTANDVLPAEYTGCRAGGTRLVLEETNIGIEHGAADISRSDWLSGSSGLCVKYHKLATDVRDFSLDAPGWFLSLETENDQGKLDIFQKWLIKKKLGNFVVNPTSTVDRIIHG